MKVREVLNQIVDLFKSGEIPAAVAFIKNPSFVIPSQKWSFLNQLIMFSNKTMDARGFRQWLEAKRYVKKGSHAIHILAPVMVKMKKELTEDFFLVGFKSIPVFRYEDTEGEPIDYKQIALPELPLLERAREWGISVEAIPDNDAFYGLYSHDRKEIRLATPEEAVFFHELTHAGHSRIKPKETRGQDPIREIVAELGAAALCRLVGREPDRTLGNSYEYIEQYAKKAKMTPITACIQVLNEVEQVLELILKGGKDETVNLARTGTDDFSAKSGMG